MFKLSILVKNRIEIYKFKKIYKHMTFYVV